MRKGTKAKRIYNPLALWAKLILELHHKLMPYLKHGLKSVY